MQPDDRFDDDFRETPDGPASSRRRWQPRPVPAGAADPPRPPAGRRAPDPLERLAGLENFGIRPGLDTIRRLTAALGNPQDAFPSIIVAGTNGKGSVAAMIDSALRAAGYRAGRYTSPHLTSVTERFTVAGVPIDEAALREEADRVFRQADALSGADGSAQPPTFFETATAIALSWFRRAEVDAAVVEVGLGGRLDATNVVTPAAGVLTPIGLDHQAHLGDTIEAIAAEKAGVVKPGMVVVTTETAPAALAVFEDACRRRGARLVRAAADTVVEVRGRAPAPLIEVTTPNRRYPPFRPALAGAHQRSNAAGAVRLLETLAEVGLPVAPDAVVRGLSDAEWPGRLDLVRVPGRGAVLLDAAHNPAAAAALARYLREAFPDRLPIVCAVMRDKDADGIIEHLAPCASRIVCTAPATPRATAPRALADRVRARTAVPVTVADEPRRALEAAWRTAPTVCATGSVFLVGELLAALRGPDVPPPPTRRRRR